MTGTGETAALVDVLTAKSVAIEAVFTGTGEATVLSVNVGADRRVFEWHLRHCDVFALTGRG